MGKGLASERVVVSAPMSFSGAAGRCRVWFKGLWFPLVGLPLLLGWWLLIVCWYAFFGLLLVPYRLLRRGSRKRKRDELRHREQLAAIQQGHQPR